jgi:hypothetical protein
VQLILTVIITYITGKFNERKAMMSILKKFFFVKTKRTDWFKTRADRGEDLWCYSLYNQHKAKQCLYFFSCCGYPGMSKDAKKYQKLMEQGEEKLNKYVNIRSIMGILDEHHRLLQKLNTTDTKMEEKIFDYYLYLDTEDE